MTYIQVNGKQINLKPSSSRFQKTAYNMCQDIYKDFSKIGVEKEFIDLPIPRNTLQRDYPASIRWTINGKDYFFQCSTQDKFINNLGVLASVIHYECYAIRNGMKSLGQTMKQFSLEYSDSQDKTKSPKEIIGVPENTTDFEYITFKYKQKAKELHPDQETGDQRKFQELEQAYTELKKQFNK